MADEKVLSMLKRARMAEEKAIPIYTKHLESALFWTGVPASTASRVKEILRRLAAESAGHKATVEQLIAQLERR